jgi:hypothetical protein
LTERQIDARRSFRFPNGVSRHVGNRLAPNSGILRTVLLDII